MIGGKYVTLAEVQIFNDSCEHESFSCCDRCLCEWINSKIEEGAALERHKFEALQRSLDEALNSGDGSYRP